MIREKMARLSPLCRMKNILKKAVLFLICLYALPVWALDVPPLAGKRVHDLAGVLTEPQRQALTLRLAEFEKKTSNQVALLLINSLDGEPIESFSLRAAETWKMGQKGLDNGLLITIAVKDKKYRLEVGYGLEGALPDGFVGSIGRQYFRPNFQKGDYFAGITQALDAILTASRGEYHGKTKQKESPDNFIITSLLAALALIGFFRNRLMGGAIGFIEGIIFSSLLSATLAITIATAIIGCIVGWLLASNTRFLGGFYPGGYWSSHSNGGGGDFFGGGGSFGGGGASGDW